MVASSNHTVGNNRKIEPFSQWGEIGNLKFEAYFEVLHSILVEDSLRALKAHHWLPLVTNGCLRNPIVSG